MKTENKKSPKVAIILVALLALFQIMRITAYSIIKDSLAGVNAEAWLFPAMMDVFIGTSALFVAFGIWRGKGLLPWVSAIVFFALSISDHIDAVSVLLTSKGTPPAAMSPSMVPMLLVMSLVEAAAIWALTSKSMREHYLQ